MHTKIIEITHILLIETDKYDKHDISSLTNG